MQRPISIVNFERCYLGALVVSLINSVLVWSTLQNNPAVQQSVQQFGAWFVPATMVLGIVIQLLLWYFTARRASVVTKWIIVVFFVFGVISMLMSLGMGTLPPGLLGVLAIVGFVLNAVAVWLLFKPDAKRWFSGADDDYADTFA